MLNEDEKLRDMFEKCNFEPLAICHEHYWEIFPDNTFPYCGDQETCMVRYIPTQVIEAIHEMYGFLPRPDWYKYKIF